MPNPKTIVRLIALLILLGVVSVAYFSQSPSRSLSPFSSDGCSLFPDRSLINSDDWCDCCVEHDIAYWQGGTETQRLAADQALRDCVLEKTSDEALAEMMYQGVRFGGSPYFYNWYRWGYGWSYERNYQELTEQEQARANELLNEYFKDNPSSPCKQ